MLRRFAALSGTAILLACTSATADAHRTEGVHTRAGLASCAGAVSWQSARRMIGRVATIRGPVVGTKYASYSNGSPTFLDMGLDYPSSRRFTVVIWSENRRRFGAPEKRYRGRTICVRGLVDTYAGVPQIEATSPSQILILR